MCVLFFCHMSLPSSGAEEVDVAANEAAADRGYLLLYMAEVMPSKAK